MSPANVPHKSSLGFVSCTLRVNKAIVLKSDPIEPGVFPWLDWAYIDVGYSLRTKPPTTVRISHVTLPMYVTCLCKW